MKRPRVGHIARRPVTASPPSHPRAGRSALTRWPDLDRRPAYRLTQAQAADLLGVSVARVAELVADGRLTPVAKQRTRACCGMWRLSNADR